VPTCPSCAEEVPGEFPFCPFCAAPLGADASAAAREERKVVSVLFCDLVGFTAASDAADPEDVRARIGPYHARLRRELERHGGTVEKFIGDAVMAVFGAPIAHEDDAERAVRAGLRILEAIDELNEEDASLSLRVRIGIDTGQAVVALGVRPEQGEGIVTGDVVNTASRLQGAAPVNGIACSDQTHRQTERVFDYEELDPVTVKGKAEPLALYRPLRARARFGTDVTRTHTTPFVGRELEKTLLIGMLERSIQQRSCQLATIVGEPGVGKSRLCAELFGYIEDRPGLVRWRQGRSLPYGEGIAFWALGEIVKAECGILESDSPEEADAKVAAALSADDPDFAWLKARLAPLVGTGGDPVDQEESFTAWRRFLELLAAGRETVLVLEDLHWADAALLSFLEYLAEWAEDVPLLILCTARPELYEQHPHFGADARNAQRINLAPLSDVETARLLATLLDEAVLPAEIQQALLDRAGGNPLYAEEFARLLADRDLLAGALEDVPFPDSVHALISARLDTLSPDRKQLLQDAAVVGSVFWSGAVVEMGDREPREVEQALHELTRKELVRPARTSTMEGDREYGFWHLLVRDVCYAQIPRAARAVRHEAAADWIRRRAGDRVEDLADVLAHHYLVALDLSSASGHDDEARGLATQAIHYLVLAGERALPLDVASAEAHLARALDLAPAGHSERAHLLQRWASAAQQQGRLQEARAALEEALDLYRQRDDAISVGKTLTTLNVVLRRLGEYPHAEQVIAEAVSLLELETHGNDLIAAYTELAGTRWMGGAYEDAIVSAERALSSAAELGLAQPAHALGYRGGSRSFLGDRDGLEDMRRALELAIEQGLTRQAAVIHNNLAICAWLYEGPSSAVAACAEGLEFSERRGITEWALGIAAQSLTFRAQTGDAEETLAETGSLAARLEEIGSADALEARSVQLRLLAQRGEPAPAAVQNTEALVADARLGGEPQVMGMMFAAAAELLAGAGRSAQVESLLAELDQLENSRNEPYYIANLPGLVRLAYGFELHELATRLVAGVEPRTPLAEHALRACRAALTEAASEHAEAAALYAEAAERWRGFGDVPEHAFALLGQGRCLLSLGDPGAGAPLLEARELFASMGFAPALAEVDDLLGPAAMEAV
jgi:class 3 adenylate cyclase/tetratricopeptide (TPR) repeat protein